MTIQQVSEFLERNGIKNKIKRQCTWTGSCYWEEDIIILKKENMEKPSRFVTEDGSAVAFLIECSKIAEYKADFRT